MKSGPRDLFGFMSSGVAASALILFGFTLTVKSNCPMLILASQALLTLSMFFSSIASVIGNLINEFIEESSLAETLHGIMAGLGLTTMGLGLLLLTIDISLYLAIPFTLGLLSLVILQYSYNSLIAANDKNDKSNCNCS